MPGLADLPLVVVLSMFVLACVSALFVLYNHKKPLMMIGIILVLLGGASNIADRVLYGYVVDWIPIGGLFITNVADGMIIVGILTCFCSYYDCARTFNRVNRTRK